jgi:hypothetical protein
MIAADASGRFVISTDLGLDQILVWKFDDRAGVLTPNDPAASDATDRDSVTASIKAAYEAVRYRSRPCPTSAPAHVATIARMWPDAPDPSTARVLEIGCGDGGNWCRWLQRRRGTLRRCRPVAGCDRRGARHGIRLALPTSSSTPWT